MIVPRSKVISRDRAIEICPALYANAPAEHTSPNYQFVNTGALVDRLISQRWEIIQVSQQKVRNADKREGTKHQVTLRMQDWKPAREHLGGLYPAIRLINSHDWSSRLILSILLMRLVCDNGLTVELPQMHGAFFRHDNPIQGLEIILAQMVETAEKMYAIAEAWHGIELDGAKLLEFGHKAAAIRFGDKADELHTRALLQPKRSSDNGNTLWLAYNRVQENAIKGGAKEEGMARSIRALTNIQASHDINTRLFQLAQSYAK